MSPGGRGIRGHLARPQRGTGHGGGRAAAKNRRAARGENGAEPAVCITVSIGIASQREGPFNLDELLSRADQALYLAKHNGRNRVERYSAEQASPSVGQSCGT
ncbi:diguanylate cyclase [Aeromonas caviae]